MIETVARLKELRPDLVSDFEAMTHEELLNQIYLEIIDGLNMEDRVQLFMSECTNLSKTTYNLEVIKILIGDRQEKDIIDWCQIVVEDSEGDDDYILKEVKGKGK